ncbi:hypothetical protein VTK73DRAFT_614 [Phialemonium thermophilum]|uniref:ethanolamine kinase n=1 Tax=Phialemonium thermophilum TaxID=223376 RepID=A0ABR3XDH0_9PEZI
MSTSSTHGPQGSSKRQIRFIPLRYSSEDSRASALRLLTELKPDWREDSEHITLRRFTDGITNTLLKAVNRRPDLSEEEADADAILLRAYGHGTDLIIDRHRETQNHELLSHYGLAPELLARFENGMLYRFIRGTVTTPEDLRLPRIYRAVARRLAQWHGTVPCIPGPTGHSRKSSLVENCKTKGAEVTASEASGIAPLDETEFQRAIDSIAPSKPSPNVWTVLQKWIFALPTETEAQRARQAILQKELKRLVAELSERDVLGKNGLVFAHCDLLCGNIIVLPRGEKAGQANGSTVTGAANGADDANVESVAFIDYEYATPSPAAFDIANHFAEWGGFDCDFSVLPTRKQRRIFIDEYVRAYFRFTRPAEPASEAEIGAVTTKLFEEVDIFRGLPGFYWGVWALIQATISDIDFDYASYAETRLGEYWAWRSEVEGTREAEGKEMPLRERRWRQES